MANDGTPSPGADLEILCTMYLYILLILMMISDKGIKNFSVCVCVPCVWGGGGGVYSAVGQHHSHVYE